MKSQELLLTKYREMEFQLKTVKQEHEALKALVSVIKDEDLRNGEIILHIKKAKTVNEWSMTDIYLLAARDYRGGMATKTYS